VQIFAEASQKFTCPVVRFAEPDVTVAVKVNSLPEVKIPPDETEVAPEFIANVVLVGTDAAARGTQQRKTRISAEKRGARANLAVFRTLLHSRSHAHNTPPQLIEKRPQSAA
jgi:hypothetical protein